MNETVITLFGTIDRYWYNKNYLKYLTNQYGSVKIENGFQLWR